MALKVVLAEGQGLMLDGIRRALEDAEGIEIVAVARSGAAVLPLVGRTDPDVVLLDVRMSGIDGLGCLELVRKHHPRVKVLMFSDSSEPEHIQRALRRGADGYVLKSINPIDLPSALRQAVEGSVYHPVGPVEASGATMGKAAGLSKREREILSRLARGLSNRAIARELWVTEQTVKFHLTSIYRKLDVANRTEAARYGYQHGLVDSPLLEDGRRRTNPEMVVA